MNLDMRDVIVTQYTNATSLVHMEMTHTKSGITVSGVGGAIVIRSQLINELKAELRGIPSE